MSKQGKKKKMSNRKFLGIMVPVIALLLVITMAANVAAYAFYDTVEMWFNGSGASFHSEDALTARAHAGLSHPCRRTCSRRSRSSETDRDQQ